MFESSCVVTGNPEVERIEQDSEISISLKYESDKMLAKKMQDMEICNRVTYIETKHIPRNTNLNNSHSQSEDDSDMEDDVLSDIAGSWEDGGAWEKYDLSGMPIIPYNRWKKEQDLRRSSKYVIIQTKRKKMILDLLSSNSKYLIFKKRFINPKMFFEPVRYRSLLQKVKDRKNDKIATEFYENLDEYTISLIDKMIKRGIIKNVNSILTIKAKNSILLHAEKGPNCKCDSQNLVLKIYKRTFVQYDWIKYVNECVWVTNWEQPHITHLPRGVVNTMAAREISILTKMKTLGIPCPEVVELPERLQRHIVVMSFAENEDEIPQSYLKQKYSDQEITD